jgi:hypothetical protein
MDSMKEAILVWSTIPLDTDLGKIGNPKEVPPWCKVEVCRQGHRREAGGRPDWSPTKGPGGSRSSWNKTRSEGMRSRREEAM